MHYKSGNCGRPQRLDHISWMATMNLICLGTWLQCGLDYSGGVIVKLMDPQSSVYGSVVISLPCSDWACCSYSQDEEQPIIPQLQRGRFHLHVAGTGQAGHSGGYWQQAELRIEMVQAEQ